MSEKTINRISELFSKNLNIWVILSMDVILSAVAVYMLLPFATELGARISTLHFYFLIVGSKTLLSTVLYLAFGINRMVIRRLSWKDVLRIMIAQCSVDFALAIEVSVCISLGILVRMSGHIFGFVFSDLIATVFLLVAVRVGMIAVYESFLNRTRINNKLDGVLIYGTSDKSVALVERLKVSKHYRILGFIVNSSEKITTKIAEYPVYNVSSAESLSKLLDRVYFKAILFPTEKDARLEQSGLVAYANSYSIKTLLSPTIDEITRSGVRLSGIREVKIEDLLGREEIQIDIKKITEYFHGKTVMVTGAAGSIGSEICRQMAQFRVEKLILFDNAETPMHNLRLEIESQYPYLQFVPIIGDVRQLPRLDFAFRTYTPDVVFHAAAYKHVPLMEENPCEAALVNVVGSRNVADKCVEYGVDRMVMISTDKAVNPTNVMGCSKRLAEIYIQSLGLAIDSGEVNGKTKFITTRFGNVLGSNGSVIPRFRDQILSGGPVTVTHPDINRFFMTIPEACRLVMEAATLGDENKIFVFDMGNPVKIDYLARRMIELAGLVPDVDINVVYTGLRPGEKLYEEVLATAENTTATKHERIMVAKVREYDYAEAVKYVSEIETLSRAVKIPQLVMLMKKIVPEYVSNNSRFCEYDKHE